MTTKILETPSESQALIRRAAFRLLLADSAPIGVEQLKPDEEQRLDDHRRERRDGAEDWIATTNQR